MSMKWTHNNTSDKALHSVRASTKNRVCRLVTPRTRTVRNGGVVGHAPYASERREQLVTKRLALHDKMLNKASSCWTALSTKQRVFASAKLFAENTPLSCGWRKRLSANEMHV